MTHIDSYCVISFHNLHIRVHEPWRISLYINLTPCQRENIVSLVRSVEEHPLWHDAPEAISHLETDGPWQYPRGGVFAILQTPLDNQSLIYQSSRKIHTSSLASVFFSFFDLRRSTLVHSPSLFDSAS